MLQCKFYKGGYFCMYAKHLPKRILSLLLSLSMLLSLTVLTVSAAESVSSAGGWYYTTDGKSATVTYVSDAVKGYEAILIPAELDGIAVKTLGSGANNVITNSDGWLLVPEGVEAISAGMFYDMNRTPGWSFPSTLTVMEPGATASCGGVFYTALSKAAADYAKSNSFETDGSAMEQLTISAGENGEVYPNGTYNLPAALVSAKLAVSYTVTADIGYQIAALTVNGQSVAEAAGANEYTGTLTVAAGKVEVTFEADADDTRTESTDPADTYQAPAIVDGAVAEGAQLPADVYEYAPDTDGEGSNKYSSTMGVMTGTHYAVDGVIYEMVSVTQNVLYRSKAEVINAAYQNDGLVYGEDYDLIRLFNYVHNYANGPRPGNFQMYCCYLYKSTGGNEVSDVASNLEWERAYEHVNDDGTYNTIQGDVSTLFVQAGESVTVSNLKSQNNTIPYGPSEAANFYGLGSAILVDGGDSGAKGKYLNVIRDVVDNSTASVNIIDPYVSGAENVIYAVAGGVAHLEGGRYFGTSSGGHGLYVGLGGQITLNSNDNIVDPVTGEIEMDYEDLVANVLDERPAMDLGSATSAEPNKDWNSYAKPVFPEDEGVEIDEDIAVLVTADETGTALTTDSGGGIIIANRLSATTYGRGCAGVYSIGYDESMVFVYNTALHSRADSALCSTSGGFILAFNTELEGVGGIKTRSGGGNGNYDGVTIYNSKVTASFDPSAYDFYHMATDEDTWEDASAFKNWSWADDKSMVNCPMLNLFVNKTNCTFEGDISTEMSYWYQDKNTAPQTGEAVAPILATGTATIDSYSVCYVNENYANYADEGANNYLIAADNGGTANINFYDQNRETKWDLTGASNETTELNGDLYIAATITMTGPDAGSGPSSADIHFYNSEWDGKVVGYLRNADLDFDAESVWTVTGNTGVGNLVLASESCVTASEPVTVKVYGELTIGGKAVTEDTTIGNVTFDVGAQSVYFNDLETTYAWCAEYADDLAKEGYIEAGSLNPAEDTSRAEFVEILYKAADAPEIEGANPFKDVAADSPYLNAIVWAYEKGITLGDGQGNFNPDNNLSREDAMTFMLRAFEALNIDTDKVVVGDLSTYADVATIAGYAQEAVATLVGMGVVEGFENKLAPRNELCNADIVKMVSVLLENVKASGGMFGGMMPPGMEGMMPGMMPGMDMGGMMPGGDMGGMPGMPGDMGGGMAPPM